MPETILWKHPEEIFENKPYAVFQNSILPQDIKQGKLGDCYFLSSLASISLSTIILTRIMETSEISSYGMYGFWFFIDG